MTECSRVGESSCPRKYFWATMFVAFCDHVAGNSTSFCSKTEPIFASRVSHSTDSNGCTPAWVNRRRTLSASPARGPVVTAVCGVCSMSGLLLPNSLRLAGRERGEAGVSGW